MVTHYCACRELDKEIPFDFADIICGSCSLCGKTIRLIDPPAVPAWMPSQAAFADLPVKQPALTEQTG